MALSAHIGVFFGKRWRLPEGAVRDDFGIIQGATLTLLGLIIGFTFSMALNRYEQRKNLALAVSRIRKERFYEHGQRRRLNV